MQRLIYRDLTECKEAVLLQTGEPHGATRVPFFYRWNAHGLTRHDSTTWFVLGDPYVAHVISAWNYGELPRRPIRYYAVQKNTENPARFKVLE